LIDTFNRFSSPFAHNRGALFPQTLEVGSPADGATSAKAGGLKPARVSAHQRRAQLASQSGRNLPTCRWDSFEQPLAGWLAGCLSVCLAGWLAG